MLHGSRNIVCISTIDWDFVWQGHQEIMSTLARQGHRVLFIENTGVRSVKLKDLPRLKHRLLNWRKGIKGIRKAMDNVYVYAPLVLPFPYSRIARAINKAMMVWTLRNWTRSMRFDNPIIWTWLPTGLTLELIKMLNAQLVIYYCCDDFQASSSGSRRIRETEDVLLRQADLVFAHSKALYDRCIRLNDRVHVFQYGFNREIFTRAGGGRPPDMEGIPRPIIGYVGGIHWHIDVELLEAIATARPDQSLVLVGPLQMDVTRLAGLPNVHFLGQKAYADLPGYIQHFDVGLIPYLLNDYTRSVYPTKLNEYLIMGKPVVSTALPEVTYFNQCHHGIVSVATGRQDFVARVQAALAQDTPALRAERIKEVEPNAWGEKIAAMESLIQAKLEEKSKQREVDWQQALVKLYRTSQRKLAGAVLAIMLTYGLIFHTPAVSSLAQPLRIADAPAPADAIVVLAGGIGESGEPGEAYQEKVQQAVALYRQGYAPNVILVSGVQFVFREAQVMKALAVASGIPETAIILEEGPGGNYSALLNVKRIMDSKGWRRMLLVTSRYNTARSQLVVRKHLAAMDVRFTPAPRSAFFGESGPTQWRQVHAILHEYGAIVYYWLKGYI